MLPVETNPGNSGASLLGSALLASAAMDRSDPVIVEARPRLEVVTQRAATDLAQVRASFTDATSDHKQIPRLFS